MACPVSAFECTSCSPFPSILFPHQPPSQHLTPSHPTRALGLKTLMRLNHFLTLRNAYCPSNCHWVADSPTEVRMVDLERCYRGASQVAQAEGRDLPCDMSLERRIGPNVRFEMGKGWTGITVLSSGQVPVDDATKPAVFLSMSEPSAVGIETTVLPSYFRCVWKSSVGLATGFSFSCQAVEISDDFRRG